MQTKGIKNRVLEWFIKEGVIRKEDNLYTADRAFLANTVVNSIRKHATEKKITPEEVEKSMNMVRLFLQNKLDLRWSGDIIQVLLHADEETRVSVRESPDEKQGNVI